MPPSASPGGKAGTRCCRAPSLRPLMILRPRLYLEATSNVWPHVTAFLGDLCRACETALRRRGYSRPAARGNLLLRHSYVLHAVTLGAKQLPELEDNTGGTAHTGTSGGALDGSENDQQLRRRHLEYLTPSLKGPRGLVPVPVPVPVPRPPVCASLSSIDTADQGVWMNALNGGKSWRIRRMPSAELGVWRSAGGGAGWQSQSSRPAPVAVCACDVNNECDCRVRYTTWYHNSPK